MSAVTLLKRREGEKAGVMSSMEDLRTDLNAMKEENEVGYLVTGCNCIKGGCWNIILHSSNTSDTFNATL